MHILIYVILYNISFYNWYVKYITNMFIALLFLFYRWRNWSTEPWNSFPQYPAQLVWTALRKWANGQALRLTHADLTLFHQGPACGKWPSSVWIIPLLKTEENSPVDEKLSLHMNQQCSLVVVTLYL